MARRLVRETTNASRPRMSPIASGKIQKLLCVHGMVVIVSTPGYDLPRGSRAIRLSIVPANWLQGAFERFLWSNARRVIIGNGMTRRRFAQAIGGFSLLTAPYLAVSATKGKIYVARNYLLKNGT